MMMQLQQAAEWLGQQGLAPELRAATGQEQVAIERVHTDSRSLRAGDLFVALVGERFDGHDFLAQAQASGAAAALVQRGRAAEQLPCLEVADTRQALLALAEHWRSQLALPVIAVTGSNGKTTVTQMLASILRAAHGQAALATQGNLNNDIGLPLMVLRLRAAHRMAVFELGMNHPGEIAALAAVAQPTVALVNNAQREHQEFMHSVEAVAQENGAVLAALPADGVAVFPADDAFAPLWRGLAQGRRIVDFGAPGSAVQLRRAQWGEAGWAMELDIEGQALELQLGVLGRHNVRNAMAAAAAAWAAGVPLAAIAQGLQDFRPVQGRGVLHRFCHDDGTQQWLIDDSYNANPDSVRAAIDTLAALPAPRLLVLGDMAEVGAQGPQFHAEVGEYARARGIDGLWTLGALAAHAASAFGAQARHFESREALLQTTAQQAHLPTSMLVKGSRCMAMEQVVQAVLALDGAASGRVSL